MDSETKEIILRMETKQVLFNEQLKEKVANVGIQQESVVDKLTMINDTIKTSTKLISLTPVTIIGIGITSYMFYSGKIAEYSWLTFCLVFLSPFYGDGVRMLLSKFGKNGNNDIIR